MSYHILSAGSNQFDHSTLSVIYIYSIYQATLDQRHIQRCFIAFVKNMSRCRFTSTFFTVQGPIWSRRLISNQFFAFQQLKNRISARLNGLFLKNTNALDQSSLEANISSQSHEQHLYIINVVHQCCYCAVIVPYRDVHGDVYAWALCWLSSTWNRKTTLNLHLVSVGIKGV